MDDGASYQGQGLGSATDLFSKPRLTRSRKVKAPSSLSVASLFVGCGGLDLGFKQAGFELTWANEWEPDAAKSYSILLGHEAIVGDIWDHIDHVPKVDVIVGGPPCQAFSLVGKRLKDDPRAKLIFAYEQVINRVQPQAFVMENVPGLMASSIDGKRLPVYLAEKFMRMGYDVTILKLMATDFFVPQRRQRVLMVGHRRGHNKLQVIQKDELARLLDEPQLNGTINVAEALDDLPTPLPKGCTSMAEYVLEPHSAYSRLMRRSGCEAVTLQSMPTMSLLDQAFVRHIPPGGNYMHIPDELATRRVKSFKASGGRTTTYGRLHPDQPAYTINTYFNRPNVGANYHHREERLITVREALRLQSFPDNFTPAYRTQRSLHLQVGNAVPPLMARAVAESLKRLF